MKTLPVLIFALLLAGCSGNPFVVTPSRPAPTLDQPSEVPMGHSSITKTFSERYTPQEHPVAVPLPKPRPVVKHRKAITKPFETTLLGYSCDTVRWASKTFGRPMLDSMGAGLTDAQKAEAARCLK